MLLKKIYIISLILLTGSYFLQAQSKKDSSSNRVLKFTPSSINKTAVKLTESLSENTDENEIAAAYESLALELKTKKEYAKAEEYLQKANTIYFKRNDKYKQYLASRELAKLQELQGKYNLAYLNYMHAANFSNSDTKKKLNQNDAERVKNHLYPEVQSQYITKNIQLLDKIDLPEESKEAFQQLAEVNSQMNFNETAIDIYKKLSETFPDDNYIQKKLADVYIADKQYDKAIDINEKLLENTDKNVNAQIEQLKSLSEVYIIDNKQKEGISALKQAYQLALEEGHTLEAIKCAELVAAELVKEKKFQQGINLYKDFLNRLDGLIKSDSTLVDAKLFQITEDKIKQLEKEKALKDELITEKNTFNSVLMGSIIILVLLLFVIIKAFFAIKNKNRKIALQSLRREMNPHFLFNSLNSVNQFIAENNELEANKYLTSYSRLMRNIMENSNKDFIQLNKELEHLNEYLQLEQMRFGDKFSYAIHVDDSIDPETVSIPNMLIQPQLENAIWHGLRYKAEKGKLDLKFTNHNHHLLIIIEDDGIGLTQSKKIKTVNQKMHISRGLTNVRERILLLNELYKTGIRLDIKEKELPEMGVAVELRIMNYELRN